MTTLYGIPNCDTVRKARHWLDTAGIEYRFHDFRKDGLTRPRLQDWATRLGWETLLNRRGTTWRRLPEDVRSAVTQRTALTLMLEQPALIRRPVLEYGNHLTIGFDPGDWQARLA